MRMLELAMIGCAVFAGVTHKASAQTPLFASDWQPFNNLPTGYMQNGLAAYASVVDDPAKQLHYLGNQTSYTYSSSTSLNNGITSPYTRGANGSVRITAMAHLDPNTGKYPTGVISTATVPDGQQGAAYLEITARLPAVHGSGLWPALWALSTPDNWPYTGEMDLMEEDGLSTGVDYASGQGLINQGLPPKISGFVTTTHWGNRPNAPITGYSYGTAVYVNSDTGKGFHKWGVAYNNDTITYYFDRVKLWSMKTPTGMQNGHFYGMADFQLGGQAGAFGGLVDPAVLPQNMDVQSINFYAYAAAPATGLSGALPDIPGADTTPILGWGCCSAIPAGYVAYVAQENQYGQLPAGVQ